MRNIIEDSNSSAVYIACCVTLEINRAFCNKLSLESEILSFDGVVLIKPHCGKQGNN